MLVPPFRLHHSKNLLLFAGPPKSKQDEWGNSNPGPSGGSNWGDPRGGPQRDADLNHVRNDRWSGQPQRQTGGGGGNWGAPPPPAGGAGGGRAPGVWDHESPNMTRRPGMDDPSGTYHWGGGREKPPGPPGSGKIKTLQLTHTP